ncbi:NAD(P)-binding domain-containing protein [Berryella intestinalis]|uniref:NAD(P)-binding domain-containing protein n=1 Tax=Berryella intestinalis TaxID=1531429 RepID=UPI00068D0D67|nr:NAD(P)-binding domain-containing protein [Berryella intestinalis]
MSNRFAFQGHESIGALVRRGMEGLAWVEVDDVASANAVFTYFASLQELEDAYFGEGGIAQAAPAEALLIDLSPSTPAFSQELASLATVSGMRPVEAPLAVVDLGAADAFADMSRLACFVGGDEADVEAALPLVSAVVGTASRTGAAGSAQLARCALTLQTASQIVAAIEAEALYAATQRSVTAVEGLEGSVGAVTPQSASVLERIAEGRFDATYTVEMFLAEIAAALRAAEDVDLVVPQAEAVMNLVQLLAVLGGADKSPAAVSLLYRDEDDGRRAGLDWARAREYYEVDHSDDEEADFDGDFDGDFGEYEGGFAPDRSQDGGRDRGHAHGHDHGCGCGHHHASEAQHECECGHDSHDSGHQCCGKRHGER